MHEINGGDQDIGSIFSSRSLYPMDCECLIGLEPAPAHILWSAVHRMAVSPVSAVTATTMQ